MKKTSKIYVAGHCGFVGSAILKSLRGKGYENLITREHKRLNLVDSVATASFFKRERPEYVFLAAAKVGGILASNYHRANFIYENLMIQNNVIHQSYIHSVKKLLFLGSTCIYPKKTYQPIKEEYLLTGNLEYTHEPYAIAKIAGIKMCESYNIQYGTNFISAMPTNLYGPKDNFDLETCQILPAFLRKIHLGKLLENCDWDSIRADLNRRPIEGINGKANEKEIIGMMEKFGIRMDSNKSVKVEIGGNGKPLREFLWNGDMADACVFLMEHESFKGSFNITSSGGKQMLPQSTSDHDSGEIRNTHINIGTGKEISIAKLAKTITQVLDFKGSLVFNTSGLDGASRKITDVTKLNSLGWKHKVELNKGIEQLYQWYKATIEGTS
ncbi:GDP-L-fucose synthase [Muricauda sp. SCSIO 64092]|uniref:GDP-L-fucose synthase family protein n=1 Tax=Allomuricauda sp. SCSIO 64092 TaxID=2908842 RepID=UPI001FF2855C|nr:GDP-L-fucose synthase [Muricauda sp. SCSIO 64092]UOY05319.1 GDP-L-fucose synthase [Muricauda sp. SCSIO 64092]